MKKLTYHHGERRLKRMKICEDICSALVLTGLLYGSLTVIVFGQGTSRAPTHPLDMVGNVAREHGVPTKVIDQASADANFKVIPHDYGGDKTAGYIPTKQTLRVNTRVFDKNGIIHPEYSSSPANTVSDVFHEAFHHKWQVDKMVDKGFVKKLMPRGKVEFTRVSVARNKRARKRGVIKDPIHLTDEQAFDFVEEAIAVKFGNLVDAGVSNIDTLKKSIDRQIQRGKNIKDYQWIITAGLKRIKGSITAIFNSKGKAYANDYPDFNASLDIGMAGRAYIEKELFGMSIDSYIKGIQRKSIETLAKAHGMSPEDFAKAAGLWDFYQSIIKIPPWPKPMLKIVPPEFDPSKDPIAVELLLDPKDKRDVDGVLDSSGRTHRQIIVPPSMRE